MFSRKILFLILIYKPDRIGFTQLFVMGEGLEYCPLYWSGPRELRGRCPGLGGLQVPRHVVMLVLEEILVTVSRLKMMGLHPRLDGKAGEAREGNGLFTAHCLLATCCQSGTYSLEEPLGIEKKLSPSICASGSRGNVLVWAQSSFPTLWGPSFSEAPRSSPGRGCLELFCKHVGFTKASHTFCPQHPLPGCVSPYVPGQMYTVCLGCICN